MGAKIDIDIVSKTFIITEAPTLVNGEYVLDFDIKIDLYSDAKEDWHADPSLRVRTFPLSAVGGNPTVGSNKLGSTYFIEPDWKIALYESDHRFQVNGNFYSTDGKSPFLLPVGNSVLLEQQVSNLTDSTVSQLSEIEGMSFNNAVWVDVTSSQTGTTYPSGNSEYPVNNVQDAVLIAKSRGFIEIRIMGDLILGAGDNVDGFTLVGQNPVRTYLTVMDAASTVSCEIKEVTLVGVLDGNSTIRDSVIGPVTYVNGSIFHCILTEFGLTLGGNSQAVLIDCSSGVPGTATPLINMGGTGQPMAIRGYQGGMRIINRTGADTCSIDMDSGHIIIDSTVTNEVEPIVIRGISKLTNESTDGTIDTSGLVNTHEIAEHVWAEPVRSITETVDSNIVSVTDTPVTDVTDFHGAGGGVISTDVNVISVTGTPVTSVDDFKATETVVDLSTIPQAVWEYVTRELTVAAGLTPEQEAKLDQILIDVDNVPTSTENATEVWNYVLPNI